MILLHFKVLKGTNYNSFKFINTWNLFKLSLEYPHLSLSFNWILRLRADYKYSTINEIRSGRVSDDCTRLCPCCGKCEQSFIHWIFECSIFSLCRFESLDFIDVLFILFAYQIRKFSLLPSYSKILEYENFINRFIHKFCLEECQLQMSFNSILGNRDIYVNNF